MTSKKLKVKTTSKNGSRPQKYENGRQPQFFFEKLEGRPKKMEDDHKKNKKTTSKMKEKGRRP
jgi:hypothetical protein